MIHVATKKPWFVHERFHIARMNKQGRITIIATMNERFENYDKNAELIVRAVNSLNLQEDQE